MAQDGRLIIESFGSVGVKRSCSEVRSVGTSVSSPKGNRTSPHQQRKERALLQHIEYFRQHISHSLPEAIASPLLSNEKSDRKFHSCEL